MAKQRNSSIELLRILCMMFIIMHHIIITTIAPEFCSLLYNIADTLFHTAVVIFVIITGYFGINFKLGKLLRLWAQVAYYSIIAGLIAYFALHSIGLKQLFDCALPYYRKPYWFMSTYIELFLVAPALNVVVRSFIQKHLALLIVVLLFVNNLFPADLIFGSGLILFALLYLIGRYLRLYMDSKWSSNSKLACSIICYMLLIAALFYILPPNSSIFQKFIGFSYRYYGIGTIFLSIMIFYFFKNITFTSKLVNYATASVLSIYLIHENHLISHYVYELPTEILNTYLPSFFSLVAVALGISICCIMIDQIRLKLFSLIDPIFNAVEQKLKSAIDTLFYLGK